jgi:uncharacterized phage-associated protein
VERTTCVHQPRSAIAVANEFLRITRVNHASLDQMKLQKLVFYAHGWHLGLQRFPLLDEEVEAWQYGPVIPSIYQAFKQYGTAPITASASDINAEGRLYEPRLPVGYDRLLAEKIWEEYGQYSAIQLSKMTHRPGTPWEKTWNRNTYGLRSLAISNELIKEYFAAQAAKNRGDVVGL